MAAELVGTTWIATRYFDGGREVHVMPPAEQGSFRLEGNGYVTGHDGCNGFGYSEGAAPDGSGEDLGKSYEISEESITFTGSAVSTLAGCADQEYRTVLRSVLSGSPRYVLSERTLVLSTKEGQSVEFRAAER